MAQATSRSEGPPEELRPPYETYEQEVLRRVWDRVHRRNEHFMMCLVGREGSGKSLTALKLAKTVDPTFNADRVIFDVADLLEVLASGEHEPGNAYVLDEAGVSFGRRTWQDRAQVLANQALQLIRSHNLVLFFTLPRLGELDSQTIGRLHAFYEITKKVPDEYVTGKWKYLDPDRADDSGNIYKPFPRVTRNGKRIRVVEMKFTPPSGDFVDQYEERKSEFQTEMYSETIGELRDEEETEDDGMGVEEIAQTIKDEERLDRVISIHGGNKQPYIDTELIQIEYDTSVRDSKKVKKLLERDSDVVVEDAANTDG